MAIRPLSVTGLPRHLKVGSVDVVYVDPPNNQHSYGSNCFRLNLLTQYREPEQISFVSRIPVDRNRSGCNVKKESPRLVRELVQGFDAKFLIVSFNDEGYTPRRKWLRSSRQ